MGARGEGLAAGGITQVSESEGEAFVFVLQA